MHAPRQEVWPERLRRSGFLVGAILVHLVLFLTVATLVIWKAPAPTADAFQKVSIQPASPPPPQLPSSGAAANNPELEPQPVVVPVVTPMAVITTANRTFSVDASRILSQSLSHLDLPKAAGTGFSSGGDGKSGTGSGFGSATGADSQLTGTFFDLKQTAARKPTGMTERAYLAFLADYVRRGWDDAMLAPYYRSTAPLYTDAFAISTRPSGDAPKAFGLENDVQPGLWIVHYRAKVVAPEAGEYRMAGFGDNVLLVKIAGTTVLDGGWDSLSTAADLHEPLPFAFPSYIRLANRVHNPSLKIGPSFHLDAVESVDMDVLIGDCGGVCSFFLLVEKVGSTYDKLPDGTPKLPFFQLGNKASPTFSGTDEHPPYSTRAEPWQVPEN